jgi:Protein of unknown function (DUF4446)
MLSALSLSSQTSSMLALAGAAFGVIGSALAISANGRTRRMRRDYTILQGKDSTESFIEAVDRHIAEVRELRTDVVRTQAAVLDLRTTLAGAVQHVAVVRYDAFSDMGGRLSFSAAMLDEHGDGLVLSSINSRSETRTYAKSVHACVGEQTLSPEEEEAVAAAMSGAVRSAPAATPAARRRSSREAELHG